VVVGLIEKPDKPVDLVPGFRAELADGLKDLLRRGVRREVNARGIAKCVMRKAWALCSYGMALDHQSAPKVDRALGAP
jgi:hypothetical protein